MTRRLIQILVLGMILVLSVPAHAGGRIVKVGIFDFKPLCSAAAFRSDDADENEGLFLTLLRNIALQEKWEIDLVPGTLAEGLQRLGTAEIDLLAAAAYSKDSTVRYDFSRETIVSTWAQVYAGEKSHVQSWFDLASRSVGVVRDDAYNAELRAIVKRFDIQCRFIEFEDYRGVLDALEKNWIEIGVVDRLYGILHEKRGSVERSSIFFAPIELRFAVPKGKNADLVAAIDYHMGYMKKDPNSAYHLLMDDLFGRRDDLRVRKLFVRGLAVALCLAGLSTGMILFLRLQVKRKTIQLSENCEELKREIIMRRNAESAFRENQKRFETLFEFAPEPIFLLALEGGIIDCNKAAEDLTGCSKDSLLKMGILDLMRTGTSTAAREVTLQQITAAVRPVEIPCTKKDGGVFPVQVSSRVLDMGEERNILVIARDLTWHKKIEEEMLKAQKLESVGLLAGGIAHDFNNILAVIMGNIALARMRIGFGDSADERLDTAEQACVRAKDLVHQLLTFSRGGAPVRETASIVDVIEESCRFALRGSNVCCEFEVAEELWPAEIDIGQISRVINNIVINARQAMSDGGTLTISVTNATVTESDEIPLLSGRYVKVTIRDRGRGIPKECLSKVFDPYFTTKPAGTGLGLASCYSIVKKHGGCISLESEVGVGTSCCIHLPASAGSPAEMDRAEGRLLAGRGKILVMDDEDSIREMLEGMLTELNYEVRSVYDGSEAIRAYREAREMDRPFDVVIMDLTVPGGMGGREAIGRLLEIDPKVKAIVSSGYSNDPIMSEYRKHGFSGVVPKPYRILELSRIIHEVISCNGNGVGSKPSTVAACGDGEPLAQVSASFRG